MGDECDKVKVAALRFLPWDGCISTVLVPGLGPVRPNRYNLLYSAVTLPSRDQRPAAATTVIRIALSSSGE